MKKILWWFKPPNKPLNKVRTITTGTLLLLLLTTVAVLAAAGNEIDMTIADNSVSYNDAIFIQGPLDVNSAGTGVIDPFLTVGGGGSLDINKGYNTVDASAEFDTVTGGDRTRPLLLSGVPEVEIGGVFYREFKLDINKARGGNPYLALNELKLFLTDDPTITGYDYAGGTEFGANATKVWDLGDAVVLMNYALESGSGASDVSFFVKSSVFSTSEDCSYGSTECTTWLVMWNEYGNYMDSVLYPNRTWENNDGFEEWGVILRPVVDASKTAEGSYDRTIDWDIFKSVDPDEHNLFIGNSDSSTYEIELVKNVTEGNTAASGTITVHNPTGCGDETCPVPEDIPAEILSIDDVIDQGGVMTNAMVTCPVTFPYTLGGGETLVCTYSTSTPNADDGTNTATITVEVPENIGGGTNTYEALADLTFSLGNTFGYEAVNVDDTNDTGDAGPFNSSTTYNYNGDFTCSSAPADYTNGFYSFVVDNTATIVETGDDDDALVTVNCYAPVLAKDASASYDERHDWNIIKTVDPESQDAFAGDPVSWTWTIEIEETVVDQNFAVTGSINVSNPAGSPGNMTVDLADALNDGTSASVDCGGGATSVVVAPGATETCSYSASPADASATLNTATGTFNSIDFTATAAVSFVTNVVNDSATFNDPYLEIGDTEVTDPSTTDYPDGGVCSSNPADYGDDGKYSVSVDNEAFLQDEEGNEYSDDATTAYTCYAPVLDKNASASYDERHDWNIIKTVDPESQGAFAGDPVSWTWTIEIEETVVDQNFAVTGTIFVENPAGSPGNMTVDLADALNDGTVASVDCGGGATSVVVASGVTETCSYSASPADASATLNTATGTFNSIDFTATAAVSFVTNVVNDSATFNDPYLEIGDTEVTDPSTTDYPDGGVCSSNPADYGDDGKYSVSVDNEAFLQDEEGNEYSDDATTAYTCYAPVLAKDASASYDERHDWNIVKTVTDPVGPFYPGDEPSWTWTIEIQETVVNQNFAISGTIYVANPAGSPGNMTVGLADVLDDGTPVTLDCGGSVIVAPGATETCGYSAALADASATLNTATGTFNSIDFIATAAVNFAKNVVNGSATFSDPYLEISDTVVTDPSTTNYNEADICSSNWADYGEDGQYTVTLTNEGFLVDEEGNEYSDDATTSYTCEAGTFDLLKLTQGVANDNPSNTWSFALYYGPDGFGTEPIATDSVPPLALMDFGQPALSLDETYTVCEYDVAAGWSSKWSIDGTTVIPYNPNQDDETPQDLGNRCFDFGAGTDYPITVGATLHFVVDNTFPGGAPRTPGYWKNWSSCSNGGQYAKTTDDVDPLNEFISLDEVLNSPGITWDDILVDDFVFTIDSCELAVSILDQRDFDTGKKAANDAAFTLAMHLMAAQLNFGAGACTTQEVLETALAAETLLDKYNFDDVVHGNGKKAGYLVDNKNPDKAYALELADYLDRYNNGEFCGDFVD